MINSIPDTFMYIHLCDSRNKRNKNFSQCFDLKQGISRAQKNKYKILHFHVAFFAVSVNKLSRAELFLLSSRERDREKERAQEYSSDIISYASAT